MPIWCSATYAFKGDKKQIKDLSEKLHFLTSHQNPDLIPNDFGDNWLGNIVHGFGYNWEKISCRGSIYLSSKNFDPVKDDVFMFDTETAWGPMPEMWDIILSRFYPDVSYVFIAIEENECLFLNTDIEHKIFPEKYYVSVYDRVNDEYNDECFSSKEAKDKYIKTLNKNCEYYVYEFENYYEK